MSDTIMTVVILASVGVLSVGMWGVYLYLRRKNREKIEQHNWD